MSKLTDRIIPYPLRRLTESITSRVRSSYLGSSIRTYRFGGFAWLLAAGVLGGLLYTGLSFVAGSAPGIADTISTLGIWSLRSLMLVGFLTSVYVIGAKIFGKRKARRRVAAFGIIAAGSVLGVWETLIPFFWSLFDSSGGGLRVLIFFLSIMLVMGVTRVALSPRTVIGGLFRFK